MFQTKVVEKINRPQMTIRRMRISRWIPKATNILSEYVIIIAFLLQPWLHESASVLRHTFIAYLVSIIRAPLSHHFPPVNPVYTVRCLFIIASLHHINYYRSFFTGTGTVHSATGTLSLLFTPSHLVGAGFSSRQRLDGCSSCIPVS